MRKRAELMREYKEAMALVDEAEHARMNRQVSIYCDIIAARKKKETEKKAASLAAKKKAAEEKAAALTARKTKATQQATKTRQKVQKVKESPPTDMVSIPAGADGGSSPRTTRSGRLSQQPERL